MLLHRFAIAAAGRNGSGLAGSDVLAQIAAPEFGRQLRLVPHPKQDAAPLRGVARRNDLRLGPSGALRLAPAPAGQSASQALALALAARVGAEIAQLVGIAVQV